MPWDKLTNALWNVIFTFFPILLLGLFDQDVSAESLMKYPHLYKSGQRNDFVRFGRAMHATHAWDAAHAQTRRRSGSRASHSSTCASSLAGSSTRSTILSYAKTIRSGVWSRRAGIHGREARVCEGPLLLCMATPGRQPWEGV